MSGVYDFNNDGVVYTLEENDNGWLTFRNAPVSQSALKPVCKLLVMIDPNTHTDIYFHTEDSGSIDVIVKRQFLPKLKIKMTSSSGDTQLMNKPEISLSLTDNTTINTLGVDAAWALVQIVETQFTKVDVLSVKGYV